MTLTIATAFERAKQEKRLALIGYLPAGYPDGQTFIELVQCAFVTGLDILEIGLPTLYPRFDGDVIRAAVHQVIEQGVDTRAALDLAGVALAGVAGAGLVMFYGDSLDEYGVDRLLEHCLRQGISGILPVGMDHTRWQELAAAARQKSVAPVGFITHDMDEQTVRQIAEAAGGFLYLQSQNSPTGQQGEFGNAVRERVARLKTATACCPLPIAIGFGVRQPADVEHIRALGAQGVIVGTAFLEAAMQGIAALEEMLRGLIEAAKFD
ncbi:MAG: tryptophan synthase subunit alpha [Anaerolineaceae bacterium]